MRDGIIEQRDGRVTCRYERLLHHSIEVVWKAITDPEEIERWMGSRPEIDLRAGGHYISYHQARDRVVDRIERVEVPRLFAHTFWVHVNPTALVTWELVPTEPGCRLALTHSLGTDDVRTAAATVALGDDPSVIIPQRRWLAPSTRQARGRPRWSDHRLVRARRAGPEGPIRSHVGSE
ncbi:MAG: SRPBCC domain-containing protein [Pseudonocardiaceae bacterium]